MPSAFRKGAQIELTIEKLAFGGKGLARFDNFVIFVDHTIPGQQVRARIRRSKSQYAEAECIAVVAQPDYYTAPFCPHFGPCGGCLWQELPYAEQLHWKRRHVVECLEHLAGLDGVDVASALPAPQTTYYRNKMEFTFSDRCWLSPQQIAARELHYERRFALGLHSRGFFDRILNIETCFLQSRGSVEILKEVRSWCEASGLPPYSSKTHQGFWRFLVIREGKQTGETLVHVLTAPHPEQDRITHALALYLRQRFPWITTVVHSVSRKKAQVAVGDATQTLFGPGLIEERLDSLRYRVSAHSFFQTNTYGAEKLYETIRSLGEFTGRERVWDLYCGTGSIAIFIARQVHQVVGFEVVPDAIEDARANCRLNGIDNCTVHLGDLKDTFREPNGISRYGGVPDLVISDPPRAGMHPRVVQALLDIRPQRIIAVSCNPSTLARDIAMLARHYAVKTVQPVDLFPHTPHIECVVRLDKRALNHTSLVS